LVSQDGVQLLSRNGRVFDNFVEIQNAIQNYWEIFQSHYLPFTLNGSFVLDVEIVGKNFQQLMTQARRKTNVQTVDMTYYVFDVIPLSAFMKGQWNQSQQARSEFLERLQPKLTQNQLIQIMPGIVVDTKTSEGKVILERFARHAVEEGHEGIMIKDLDAPYVCTRNTSWLKWKPVITVDLAVTEVVAGTGRNSDRLGALVCQGIDDGRAICVNVGSGFSDQNRDEFWKYRAELIDQIVEIRADAVTQNQDGSYSLRFPRFVRFRGFQPKEKF
jgi:DNA ligase-1